MRPIKNSLLEDTDDPLMEITDQSINKHQTTVVNKSTSTHFKITDHGVYYNPLEGDSLSICSKLEIKTLVRNSASEN